MCFAYLSSLNRDLSGAIADLIQIHSDHAPDRQQDIRHRRAFFCTVCADCPSRSRWRGRRGRWAPVCGYARSNRPGGCHSRDQRVVEKVAVAVRRILQFLQGSRGTKADVVPVDLGEVGDARRTFPVMRRRVERSIHAASGIDSLAHVAAHLECRYARRVGHERQCLKIEHQLHVLFKRIRHTNGSRGECARRAARVVFFDALNAVKTQFRERRRGNLSSGCDPAGRGPFAARRHVA